MAKQHNHDTDVPESFYRSQQYRGKKYSFRHRLALHSLVGLVSFCLFFGYFNQIEQTVISKFSLQNNDTITSPLYQIPKSVALVQRHGDSDYDILGKVGQKPRLVIKINRAKKRNSTYFLTTATKTPSLDFTLTKERKIQIAALDKRAAEYKVELAALQRFNHIQAKKADSKHVEIKAGEQARSQTDLPPAFETQPNAEDLVSVSKISPKILSSDEIEKLKLSVDQEVATFMPEQMAPMPTIHSSKIKSEFVENMLAQATAKAHETKIGWTAGNGKTSSIRRQTVSLDKLNGFTVVNGKLATRAYKPEGDRVLLASVKVPAPVKRPKNIPKSSNTFKSKNQAVSVSSRTALTCLTTALYHEVRGESRSGQLAVAEVIKARKQSRSYPNSFCGVIYQNAHRRNACQFSFACDGKTDLPRDLKTWQKMKNLAGEFLAGRAGQRSVRGATHYHATYVNPKWRWAMKRLGRIGSHIFYKDPKVRI